MPKRVYWLSPVPLKCDTCSAPIEEVFYDMKTTMGSWGCLCSQCAVYGPGINKLGTGYGQKYAKQDDDRWLKVEG